MTPKCIMASILLAIGALMILISEYHKEEIQDYMDLTLNETMIQEYILI